MQRDDLIYAGHMLDTARKVLGKVEGLSRTDFDDDENLRIAVTPLMQVIGEAASRVSPETRSRIGASFRSRCPVCFEAVHGAAQGSRHPDQHVAEGEPLGKRGL